MSACRSCSARVVWAKTTNGKRIPLDAVDQGGRDVPITSDEGNLEPTGRYSSDGSMVVTVVPAGEGEYRSHFASCPEADQWRRPR